MTSPLNLNKLYAWRGEVRTLGEWSRILGATPRALYVRYIRTRSFETKKPRTLYEFDGLQDTATGWARRFGMKSETMRRRLQICGGDMAAALNMPGRGNWRSLHAGVEVDGKRLTLSEWARRLGCSPHWLYDWKRKNGGTMPDAIRAAHKRNAKKKYEIDGKKLTLKGWAKELGVPLEELYERLTRGERPEVALMPREAYEARHAPAPEAEPAPEADELARQITVAETLLKQFAFGATIEDLERIAWEPVSGVAVVRGMGYSLIEYRCILRRDGCGELQAIMRATGGVICRRELHAGAIVNNAVKIK